MKKGKLYLIPVPLADDALHTLPTGVIQILHQLKYLLAERAKTARHFIKSTHPKRPISTWHIEELNKRTHRKDKPALLQPLREGQDMGLLSEAGCPGIADPGAIVVRLAHEEDFEVVPLVGPSSILMALMASGMNGQGFTFHGYLSPKKPQLIQDLKKLESLSAKTGHTQIFMETPYRNNAVVEAMPKALSGATLFAIAVDITGEKEWVRTKPVNDWMRNPPPDLHKRPAVFLLLANK